jgi:hypothetical protein
VTGSPQPDGSVVVDEEGWLLVWLGFPLVGGLVGWFVPALADWLAGLPMAPFEGLSWLVGRLPDPVAAPALAGAGALAGLAFGVVAARERVRLVVSSDAVVFGRGPRRVALARPAVAAAFHDGRKVLVLTGPHGEERLREPAGLPREKVREALESRGYTYLREDPHGAEFRLWAPGVIGLPPGADAVLAARRLALERKRRDDAAVLRDELWRLGIAVRDEGTRQLWRATVPPMDRPY